MRPRRLNEGVGTLQSVRIAREIHSFFYYAKRSYKNMPMEARMMFANCNVPLGETEVTDENGKTKIYYVKSVPCKDVEQGKALLTEFIEKFDKDKDVKQTLVRWFNENEKLKFDNDTLPEVS